MNPVFWKQICGYLFTVIFTGVASWFSFGNDRISRTETIDLISVYSPYIKDAKLIQQGFADIQDMKDELQKLNQRVERLNTILEERQ